MYSISIIQEDLSSVWRLVDFLVYSILLSNLLYDGKSDQHVYIRSSPTRSTWESHPVWYWSVSLTVFAFAPFPNTNDLLFWLCVDSHPNPQRLLRQLLNRLPPDNQEICRSMLQIGWNIITQEDLQSKLFPLKSSSYASTVPVLGTVNGASTFNSTTTRDLQRNWRSRPATEDASTLTNSQTPLHSSYLSNLRKVQNGNGLDSDTGNGAKNGTLFLHYLICGLFISFLIWFSEPRLNPEWLIENSYVKPSYKSNKSPSDYFSASHSHSSPPLSSSSLTVIQQKNVSSQEIVYTRDELFKLVANQNLQLVILLYYLKFCWLICIYSFTDCDKRKPCFLF